MMKNKLVLGTVQLGLPYGISNTTGKPDEIAAISILDKAFEGGIDMFDTAAAYGTSEEVIGHWITARSLSKRVRIISKLPPSPGGDTRTVLAAVTASLQRLNQKKLEGYLLHSAVDMDSQSVMDGMLAARKNGLFSHVGVSVYTPAQAMHAAELGLEYVQIAYNVFDRRLDTSGFFKIAKAKGMTVFARSPFLQGLLLMQTHSIPPHLSHARALVERFQSIAHSHGYTPLAAALLYVHSHSGIDHIVFGVEKISQLEEILAVFEIATDFSSCEAELKDAFPSIEESIIDPTTWSSA